MATNFLRHVLLTKNTLKFTKKNLKEEANKVDS